MNPIFAEYGIAGGIYPALAAAYKMGLQTPSRNASLPFTDNPYITTRPSNQKASGPTQKKVARI